MTLFSGPLAQAVGWALLHLLWQGVLVAAILAAALALLQKQSANARYLASCGALIVIVMLSVVTAYRAYEPIRISNQAISVPVEDSGPPLSVIAGPPRSAVLQWTALVDSHLPQIVFVWLLGVTLLSSRLILGWVTAHRLASRYARAAQTQWHESMERLAAALHVRRTIQLLESAAVDVPTVVGWLRPVILLPVSTLSGLSLEQIEMILAHELAHIRRHDFVINLLQSTVETLFFYQPAVWWISRRIRIEREHCCDDIAVAATGDAIRYARALTRFEELRFDHAQAVLAASGGSLVARIRRLVRADAESATWSSRWTAGAALLIVVAALLVGPSLPAFANHEPQVAPAAPVVHAPQATSTCTTSNSEIDVEENAPDPDDDNDPADDQNSKTPPPPESPTMPSPAVAVVAPAVDVDAVVAPVAAQAAMFGVRVASAFAPAAFPAFAQRRISRKIDERHLTVDDLITLRSIGVTPRYIDEMRAAGLRDASLNDLLEMRTQGVNPKYVRDMANAGYKSLSPKELTELRAFDVTPEFVKSLADSGYANLPVHDLVRLAASGVTADFIRDLAKYRSKQ